MTLTVFAAAFVAVVVLMMIATRSGRPRARAGYTHEGSSYMAFSDGGGSDCSSGSDGGGCSGGDGGGGGGGD